MSDKNKIFSNKEYWNSRYKSESEYDWFAKYDAFKHNIYSSICKSDRILHLGCGNSNLSVDMFNDGFKNIVNIDYSPVVIENMKLKHKNLDGMQWMVMDAKNMTYFPEESFDVVLEKGTLDALLVSEMDPWQMSTEAEEIMNQILMEVTRLLKSSSGRFISITFAQPHFRVPVYLCQPEYDWDVQIDTFGDGFHYFYYTMTRGCKPSIRCLHLLENYKQRQAAATTTVKQPQFIDSDSDDDFLLKTLCVDD